MGVGTWLRGKVAALDNAIAAEAAARFNRGRQEAINEMMAMPKAGLIDVVSASLPQKVAGLEQADVAAQQAALMRRLGRASAKPDSRQRAIERIMYAPLEEGAASPVNRALVMNPSDPMQHVNLAVATSPVARRVALPGAALVGGGLVTNGALDLLGMIGLLERGPVAVADERDVA